MTKTKGVQRVVIDENRALELLTEAVRLRGRDYVYVPGELAKRPGGTIFVCKYFEDGETGCGIGLALSIAGVSDEALADLDKMPQPGIRHLVNKGKFTRITGIELTETATRVFENFQQLQDTSAPWGRALDYARKAVKDEA